MRSFVPEGVRVHEEHNRRVLQDAALLAAAMEKGEVLEAVATMCDAAHNLHVKLPCMRGVIPYEEGAIGIAEGTVRDIALLSRVGKPVSFIVQRIEEDESGKVAVLSRRAAQERCRDAMVAQWRAGDIVEARVTRLEPFGAFVDIGCGLPALLPIACMSVSRITHPRDRVKVGDMLRCVVSTVEDGRICLSLRELLGTWEENAAQFTVGETVLGVVRSVESYGVFVELAPNLAGLAEPHEGVCVGQTACVYIKSILPDKMKVKLAIIDVGEPLSFPPPLTYFVDAAAIARWDYAPPQSGRCIGTVFDRGDA